MQVVDLKYFQLNSFFKMRITVFYKVFLFASCVGCFHSCKKIVQPPPSELTTPFKNIYINGTVSLNLYDGSENMVTEAIGYSIKPTIQDNSLYVTGWGNLSVKIKECDTIFINENSIVSGYNAAKLSHLVFKVNDVTSFSANYVNLTDSVDILLDGSGTYTFSGVTNRVNVYMNGTGAFSGTGLYSKNCKATINNSGSADVTVSDTLTGIINGNGNINYYGDPKLVKPVFISGTGQLIKK